MFEIVLNDDYERHHHFRDVLRQEADEKARAEYIESLKGRNASLEGHGDKRKSMSFLTAKRLTVDASKLNLSKKPRKTGMGRHMRNSLLLKGNEYE